MTYRPALTIALILLTPALSFAMGGRAQLEGRTREWRWDANKRFLEAPVNPLLTAAPLKATDPSQFLRLTQSGSIPRGYISLSDPQYAYAYSKFRIEHCGEGKRFSTYGNLSDLEEVECVKKYHESKFGQPMDLDALLALNQKAQSIWAQILVCNGNDIQKAREAHRQGIHCKSNPEIRRSIQGIRDDIASLSLSAPLFNTSGIYEIPSLHPFLVELAMENLAKDLADTHSLKYEYKPVESADFTNYQFVRNAALYILHDPNELKKWPLYTDVEPYKDSPEFQLLRRVLYSMHFLSLVPHDNCNSWGLWPLLTYEMKYQLRYISPLFDDLVKQEYIGVKGLLANWETKLFQACYKQAEQQPRIEHYLLSEAIFLQFANIPAQ